MLMEHDSFGEVKRLLGEFPDFLISVPIKTSNKFASQKKKKKTVKQTVTEGVLDILLDCTTVKEEKCNQQERDKTDLKSEPTNKNNLIF